MIFYRDDSAPDVDHGYTDDGALSLQSAGSEAEEGGGRSSRASHGMTMEEVERATREMLLLANAANAASSKVCVRTRPSFPLCCRPLSPSLKNFLHVLVC